MLQDFYSVFELLLPVGVSLAQSGGLAFPLLQLLLQPGAVAGAEGFHVSVAVADRGGWLRKPAPGQFRGPPFEIPDQVEVLPGREMLDFCAQALPSPQADRSAKSKKSE